MKKVCEDCKTRFDINLNDLDEGDYVTCPECNLEYTVVADEIDTTKLILIESKKLEMEKEEEELLLDDGEDYDYD